MLAAQCVPQNNVARLRAVAIPRIQAATLRTSCVVHGKTTAAQIREREAVQARLSPMGTPVVDYLLETSPYARFLDDTAITSMRDREKGLGDANVAEKLRRLRIAFANKGRKPWNVGKHHNHGATAVASRCLCTCHMQGGEVPGIHSSVARFPNAQYHRIICIDGGELHTATIEKIRKGVARAMKDPAVIDKLRKNYVAQTPETREKMKEKMQMRYGLQLHKKAFGPQSKKCNTVATDGVAVFHCQVGCSALVGFRRVGWRRGVIYERPRPKRKVRRKMTQEELEVRCPLVGYERTQPLSAGRHIGCCGGITNHRR